MYGMRVVKHYYIHLVSIYSGFSSQTITKAGVGSGLDATSKHLTTPTITSKGFVYEKAEGLSLKMENT